MKYLILLLLSFNAFADTAVFTYVPADQREDGTALLPSEIGGYNVFVNGVKNEISPLLGTATGFTLDLQSGVHTVTMTTVDTDGRESLMSVPVEANVPFNPDPVSGFSVTITININ